MKTKNELHSGIEAAAIWPRRTVKRHWLSHLLMVLAGAALLLVLSGTPSVHAANITVDGTICTLADAITAANTNAAAGGCIAGDVGSDTIDLQTNVTLGAALPAISSVIVLQGNNNTIDAAGTARVLEVGSTGTLTLEYVTITGGSASGEGGGIFNNGGTVTINNSTISDNLASTYGGGIRNVNGTLTINNSTISGNTALQSGAGVDSDADGFEVTINDTTITQNLADNGFSGGSGGGVAVGGGTVTLNRTIVSGNSSGGGGSNEILNFGTINGGNYNLFGDSSETNVQAFDFFTPGGSDITATSDGTAPTALTAILSAALDNNGIQPHTDTHALVAGSPAIDVIPTTDASCNPGTTIDQRGGARANGVNQGGAACDIGAFEYDSTQTPTAVTISGLGAQAGGTVGLAVAGAVGILALLSGGVLTRRLRRKSFNGD